MQGQSSALFERIQQNLKPNDVKITMDGQTKIFMHAKKQKSITHNQEKNRSIRQTKIEEMMEIKEKKTLKNLLKMSSICS